MKALTNNKLGQPIANIGLVLLMLSSFVAGAQNIKVTATAKSSVSVGQQFSYTITFNTNTGQFTPPSFKDFTYLGGPSQSSSMQNINGKVSLELSYTYYLRADKEGTYTIGPAKLSANGQEYTSNSVTIKVAKGQIKSDDDLFIKTYVSKTKVYDGEQLVVTHKLYSKHSLAAFESVELPSYTGFWAEELDKNAQFHITQEVHNGTRYQVATLGRSLLYAQKSGKITLDPAIVGVVIRKKVQSQSYSIFDQLMGSYKEERKKVQSEKVAIEVVPLPATNKPDDFTGLTGDFSFSVDLTKTEVEANEAVNLKIKVSGSGNLKLVNELNLEFPPDIEVYDPKVSDNIKVKDNGMSGSRTFDYVLIPRHAGDFELGPFPFNYFDSGKGKYVVLTKPSIQLKVGKGTGANAEQSQSTVAISNKEDLQVVGKDIRYIKTNDASFRERGKFFYKSGLFYGLTVGQALLFLGFVVYHNQRMKQMGNMALVKSRKATKEARKRLALANKLLKENKTNEYYEEVFKALWGYVSDKLGIPIADLNKDNLRAKLSNRGVKENVIEQYISLIDKAEFARFAPSGGTQEMGNVYQEAIEIISKVEDRV